MKKTNDREFSATPVGGEYLRYGSVQVRIPLTNPVDLRGNLNLILSEIGALHTRLRLSSLDDPVVLLEAHARITMLNRRLNPVRKRKVT